LTATFRADGSTKFGENNKYGYFPSVAAAWNLSNEDFVPAVFDNLKLRVGYGQIGNQNFAPGSALTRYALLPAGGFQITNTANPDLTWETNTTTNIGVDFALMDFKIVGSLEYFNKVTTDALFNGPVAAPAPAFTKWDNLDGEIVNSGVELALGTVLVSNEKTTVELGVNATYLKNEIRDFGNQLVEVGGIFGQGVSGATVQRLVDGQPLYVYYTNEFLGFEDDGTAIVSDDKRYLGNPNPDLLLGFNGSISVDKLSFAFNFNGAFGHQLYNNTANTVLPIGNLGTRNIDANLIGGSVQESRANPVAASSRYIESGNYLKLTNASLNYDFGEVGSVKGLRLSLTGQNLFWITNYSGFDPEVNTVNFNANGIPSFGLEYIPYPSSRTFIFSAAFTL